MGGAVTTHMIKEKAAHGFKNIILQHLRLIRQRHVLIIPNAMHYMCVANKVAEVIFKITE